MRYEDGQIAELRWKADQPTGQDAGLGKYTRTNPAGDRWQIAGQRGFIHPDAVEVVKTFVLIPVGVHERTAEAVAQRPSFQWLMAAQAALAKARDAEQAAGNAGQSRVLNELVLLLFSLAIREE